MRRILEVSIEEQEEHQHDSDGETLAQGGSAEVCQWHEQERGTNRDGAGQRTSDPPSEQVDQEENGGV